MRALSIFAATWLALSGLARALDAQGLPSATASPTLGIDAAIERLPRIGAEYTWNKDRRDWDYDTAVLHLRDHLANGGSLSDKQWQLALRNSQAIRVRERWPAGVLFAMCMEMPSWLPNCQIRLYAEDHAPPLARASSGLIGCGNCAAAATEGGWYQELECLPLGKQTVSFQVTVERLRPRSFDSRRNAAASVAPTPGVLWRGTVSFPVEVVPKIDDMLPAVRGEDADTALRRILDLSVVNDEWLRIDAEFAPEFKGTAVALELELFEGTTARGTERLWVADRPTFGGSSVQWKLPEENADLSNWSVHVRSDAAGALRSWGAVKRWEGEFVVPLRGVKRE